MTGHVPAFWRWIKQLRKEAKRIGGMRAAARRVHSKRY